MSEKKYESRIAKIFWVGSRMCIVIHLDRFEPKGYHNGYVESKFKHGYDYYEILSEGPTFGGKLEMIDDKWFIGFDTVHCFDNEQSQSLETVIKRTKEFAKSLIVEEDAMNE